MYTYSLKMKRISLDLKGVYFSLQTNQYFRINRDQETCKEIETLHLFKKYITIFDLDPLKQFQFQ